MIAVPVTPAVGSGVEALMRLCSRSIDDGSASGVVDWRRLLREAARHRVSPLLYSNLRRLDPLLIPASVLAELRDAVQANAVRVLQTAGELRRLLVEFEKAQIEVIPFKGIVLAATAYGDLSLREAGDLDLLVHRESIVRAADLLISLGHRPFYPTTTPRETAYLSALAGKQRDRYLRRHCEHHLVYAPTRLNVDLHWALSLPEFAMPLDVEGMWRRASRATVAGFEMLMLCPEELLAVLCLNGAKDCWERIDRICDVAGLLHRTPSMDWRQVFAQAKRSGSARMLRVGLLLAAELLAAPLTPEVADYVRCDARAARLVSEIRKQLDDEADPLTTSRVRRAFFDLRMRERWRDWLRYCVAPFRPGVGDWAAMPLPRSLEFLYWLMRPFRLIGRHAGALTFRRS